MYLSLWGTFRWGKVTLTIVTVCLSHKNEWKDTGRGGEMRKKRKIRACLSHRNPLVFLVSRHAQRRHEQNAVRGRGWKALKVMSQCFFGANRTRHRIRHCVLRRQGQEHINRSMKKLPLASLNVLPLFLSILPLARFATFFLITKHNVPQHSRTGSG